MNGNNNNNNTTAVSSMCNLNQIPKNLPLKKRRAYMIDSSTTDVQSNNHVQDENYPHHRSATNKQSCPQEDSLRIHVPSVVVPSPPSSPHMELLRQQYAYLLNSTTTPNLYLPSNYDCLVAQKVLAQQFLDNYRTFLEQQPCSNSSCGYTLVEDQAKGSDGTIDEHFRKSLGDKYDKATGGFLTPEDSSSNSSPTEKSPVDSIEEHFARSLGKLWPLTTPASSREPSTPSNMESVVDDHFAKALGAKTWEILKEKA